MSGYGWLMFWCKETSCTVAVWFGLRMNCFPKSSPAESWFSVRMELSRHPQLPISLSLRINYTLDISELWTLSFWNNTGQVYLCGIGANTRCHRLIRIRNSSYSKQYIPKQTIGLLQNWIYCVSVSNDKSKFHEQMGVTGSLCPCNTKTRANSVQLAKDNFGTCYRY